MKVGDEQNNGWGTGSHPLLDAASRIEAGIDTAYAAVAAGSDPAWLAPEEQGRLLERLARAEERLTALRMRALAAADEPGGVTSLTGARSAADWLADRLHVRPARLAMSAKLAAQIALRPILSAALDAGEVTIDHARAVVEVWEGLPTDALDAETVVKAEQTLVEYCAQFTPPEIRRLGRRLLEVVAPDHADELEARRLADEERAAREKTTLRLRRTSHGTRRITGEIPELHASMLDAALRAIANPKRPDNRTATDGQQITQAQRMGAAFCTLIEHLPTDGLPTHGRGPVTVVVTVDEHDLRAETAGIGRLDTGVDLSPGELRRLACQHGVLPAVMDGKSRVLDLGRSQRFFTHAQTLALRIAHPECQAKGCTIPAAFCDAHHRRPWSRGGPTDLAEGALLCSHHHHLAHDPAWSTTWHPDTTATFNPSG